MLIYLGGIKTGQGEILKRIATTKTNLEAISLRIAEVGASVQRTEKELKSISSRIKRAKDSEKQAEVTKHELSARLGSKKANLKQLGQDLETKPKQFAEAKRREDRRRESAEISMRVILQDESFITDVTEGGLVEWTWNAMWNPIGNLNQLTYVKAWDATTRNFQDWEAESNIERFKFQQEISSLEHNIENCQRQNQQASGDLIQELQDCNAQEHQLNTELVSQKGKAKLLEKEVEVLKISLSADETMLFSMVSAHRQQ